MIFKFGPTLFVARSSALVCRLLWKSIGSTSPRWRTVSKCLEASSRIDPYCTTEKAARAFALLQKRQAHMGDAVPRVQPNDNPTCIFVCQRLRSVCTCCRPFASQLCLSSRPRSTFHRLGKCGVTRRRFWTESGDVMFAAPWSSCQVYQFAPLHA